MRRYILGAALCVGVLAASVAPARAHAVLLETRPGADAVVDTAPARVELRYSEPVEVSLGGVRVFDTSGERVDRGGVFHPEQDGRAVAVELAPNLARGTYTVAWRVVSADGHPISGAFVFHVGAPGVKPRGLLERVTGANPVAEAGLWAARAATFAGVLMIVGALWLLVAGAASSVRPAARRRLASALRICVLVVGAAALSSLGFQAAAAGGTGVLSGFSPGSLAAVARTRFGLLALARISLLLAGAALWGTVARRALFAARPVSAGAATNPGAAADPAAGPARVPAAGAALWAVLLAATLSLQGHAGATEPVAFNLLADLGHLLSVGVWVGGLACLTLAVWPELGEGPNAEAPVRALSRALNVALPLVVLTGSYRAFVELGGWSALTTPYGLTFLAKLGLFVPLLVLGALNRRRLTGAPVLEQTVRDRLRRFVAGEVALAVGIVAVTALLVSLPPGRTAAGLEGPLVRTVALGDGSLEVVIDPNEVGRNDIHLTATQPDGRPLQVRAMNLSLARPAKRIGPLRLEARRLAPGHFVVQGAHIPLPGPWRLEVAARLDRFTEERAAFSFEVNR